MFCGVSCAADAGRDDNALIVSIQPLKFIVDQIVGDDFNVDVLVPTGAGPETYEPSPAQIKAAENARLVFTTGLIGFENELVGKLPDKGRIVDLSRGIPLIEGSCSHSGVEEHGGHGGHHHGVDPHIWTSPKALKLMAETAYGKINELWPDSIAYGVNYARLQERLDELDKILEAKTALSTHRSFVIFHPGLTYYARDYGLQQIALESEGKEPSARQLREVVELARRESISKVLYQSEFPRSMVEVAAAEIGAEAVEIDILGYDVVGNIFYITDLIVAE